MTRFLSLLGLLAMITPLLAAEKDEKIYEIQVRLAMDGKMDLLHEMIRDQDMKHCERLGIQTVGYFVPLNNLDNRVICIMAHKNREGQEKSWTTIHDLNDSEKKAYKEFKAKHGDVEQFSGVSMSLTATDFSPSNFAAVKGERVFELRTYIATPKNLDGLHARFRDHTVKLFEKHGMTNIAYFKFDEPKGIDNSSARENSVFYLAPYAKEKTPTDYPKITQDNGLIYLLAHKDQETAKKSFAAFQKDPDWVKAKEVSEAKAGGSLTVKNGVISLFLKPTDYSPLK